MAEETSEIQDEETAEGADAVAAGGTPKSVIMLMLLSVVVMVLTPLITIFSIKAMTKTKVEPIELTSETAQVSLPKLQVNVAETNGTRFAQIEIVVEVSEPDMVPLFDEQSDENPAGEIKRIMATVLAVVSEKNLTGLLSKDAKKRLGNEIKTELNELLRHQTTGLVTDVYFYSFLVQ